MSLFMILLLQRQRLAEWIIVEFDRRTIAALSVSVDRPLAPVMPRSSQSACFYFFLFTKDDPIMRMHKLGRD